LNRLGVVGRGWLVGWLLRVDSGSLVGHIGNIAVIAVGSVGDVLDSAIGKSHGVRSGDIAGTIGLLLALEVGLGVVISHGVSEGVGGDLIGVLLGLVSRGSVVSGSNLDNGSWGISWGGLVVGRGWGRRIRLGLRVAGSSLVGHLSNIAVISVGSVGHLLDPAVGESHGVGTLDIAGTIGGLLSIEVGLGVVISHGICEGVGRDLIGVFLSLVSGSGLVSNRGWLVSNRGWGISWGSLHNHGGWSISWGSMNCMSNNWSSMNSMMSDGVDSMMSDGMDSMMSDGMDGMMSDGMDCMVGDRGNRVERDHSVLAYWDWLVGSNGGLDLRQTLGVVHLAHGGVSGSKCLGLDQTSLLSMGGGDRLVRGLTSSNGGVVDTVVSQQDGACGGGAGHG